jgi:hypothetical protein
MGNASLESLLLHYWHYLFTIFKQFLVALKVESFSNRTIGYQDFHILVINIRCTHHHSVTFKASKRFWFEIGHHNDFALHVLEFDMLLEA